MEPQPPRQSSPNPSGYHVIGGDGQEYGPISSEQVRAWYELGRLVLDSRVRHADATKWRTLREIPELQHFRGTSNLPPVLAPHPTHPVYPANQMSPEDEAKAKRLILISRILGYDGLVVLFVGSIVMGVVFDSGVATGACAVLGLIMAGVGPVI